MKLHGKRYLQMKKGDIVWYFDSKLKTWKKGKIHAINKYSLAIKKRHDAYKGCWARYIGRCYPASMTKPEFTPQDREIVRTIYHEYTPFPTPKFSNRRFDRNTKILYLQRLKIIKEVYD